MLDIKHTIKIMKEKNDMLVETRKLNKKERVVVSSLDVAGTFTYFDEESQREYTREHKAVLRAIRELKCSEKFRGEHFSPSTYIDSRGKEQPCELMDKDGFVMNGARKLIAA